MPGTATASSDTVPFPITGDKLRRRPSPDRAMVRVSWDGQPELPAQVTDESDGGIGLNVALGAAPPLDSQATVRYWDGEERQANVRHVVTDGGCVHLGLAWIDRD